MIRVDVQDKSFGSVRVLRDIRFDLPTDQTLALVGPSGVGKSTLLRLIAGIDTEFTGNIDRPDRIGIVFQEPTLLPWRSVLDNLRLVHPGLGRTACFAALDSVGLADKAGDFPGQLSLGQQRRLSLARGFGGAPELLIMDEPFVSLDDKTAEDMLTLTELLIAEVQPTTIFVTHAMSEAKRLATRVISLAGHPATIQSDQQKGD
ncbi:ABC transporter ATP-binding protein [Roseovarius aestuarii]|uniref:Aliphatic sulfonates import ATP-binding protein SsuB n=1 Tax=Roseovarius aestuarii TaxID=475083 RepID=A0A1X7BWA2_9RHOB|nr:ATP-binding cassette domain-containing protein [Roseovarius aestuarii]SMC13917.1 Aliphatic sulfonates import ATP-binding protein SsuB [Roseovarius aestuarii]